MVLTFHGFRGIIEVQKEGGTLPEKNGLRHPRSRERIYYGKGNRDQGKHRAEGKLRLDHRAGEGVESAAFLQLGTNDRAEQSSRPVGH